MAITTTALGSYTTQINLTGELNSTAMIAALDAAIVAGGWAQFDVYAGGTQRIYRALNKDAVTYKYVSFFIDTATLKISTTCFESWNATTHVGTNEVYTMFSGGIGATRLGACGYNLASSDILLMISSRWCLIQTFIKGQPSQWSGVFEIMREAAEDTAAAGYPCFAWACSTTFPALAFPRTRAGLLGSSAVATGVQTPYGRVTASTQFNAYVPYAYDVTKRIIQSLRPALSATEIHGRVYGLKGVYDVGSPYSRVTVPIDAEFNYLSSGTSAEHWVLGDTSTPAVTYVGLAGAANAYASVQSNTVTSTQANYISAVVNLAGAYYVGLGTTGIAKFDAGPGLVVISQALPAFGATSTANDLCSDGRYLYASTSTGISRIDPQNNDSVTALALTNGGASLYFDGTSVWVGALGNRINNTIYRVDPSTFTLTSTVTLGNATTGVIGGMTTDFNGNLYAPVFNINGTPAVYKITISTGVNSVFVASGAGSAYLAGLTFDGTFISLGLQISQSSVNLQSWNLAGVSQSNVNSGTFTGLSLGLPSATLYKPSMAKIGVHTLIGGAQNSTNTSGFLFGSTTPGITAQTIVAQASAVFCDGNKLVLAGNINNSTSQTLTVINNIHHPDDAVGAVITLRGRMLLPK